MVEFDKAEDACRLGSNVCWEMGKRNKKASQRGEGVRPVVVLPLRVRQPEKEHAMDLW